MGPAMRGALQRHFASFLLTRAAGIVPSTLPLLLLPVPRVKFSVYHADRSRQGHSAKREWLLLALNRMAQLANLPGEMPRPVVLWCKDARELVLAMAAQLRF